MAMNAASAVLRSRILAASALAACATVAGCYSTSGGYLPHTDGGFTYESTQMRPTTISVLNICERTEAHPDGTPFFIMEIPPGKQLTFNFDEEGGDDPVNRPARMMYSLWKIGTQTGSLDNIMSCPGKACRKIVVDYRPAPEQARPDESYRLQVDADAPGPVAQPRAPRNDRHNPDT
jgi:hypothetical protein